MADDPKFYSVGEKVILETWFQDTGWDTLSQRTRKILLQQGTLRAVGQEDTLPGLSLDVTTYE